MFDKVVLRCIWFIYMTIAKFMIFEECITSLSFLLFLDDLNDHDESINGVYKLIEVASSFVAYHWLFAQVCFGGLYFSSIL